MTRQSMSARGAISNRKTASYADVAWMRGSPRMTPVVWKDVRITHYAAAAGTLLSASRASHGCHQSFSPSSRAMMPALI